MKKLSLVPIFLISAAALGFEILLTRFFSIVSWSEYAYWVISITMVGFAVSGVVLSMGEKFWKPRAERVLSVIPPLLAVSAALGYVLITLIPFNPLEFQNPGTWIDQLFNIWKYYGALFPFFFLAGSFIGLYFLAGQDSISKIYAADLFGAGAGSLLILLIMYFLHPFLLPVVIIPIILLASFFQRPPGKIPKISFIIFFIALAILCEFAIVHWNRADFNQYKDIFPPLHVEGNAVVGQKFSPEGYFLTLDNFTERLDVDFSNDAGLLHASPPPSTYGVYKDGSRIMSLPKGAFDPGYLPATLDSFPYDLRPGAAALFVGTEGGFKMLEAKTLGVSSFTALEPDPVIYNMVKNALPADARVNFLKTSPSAMGPAGEGKFDVVDVASNFLSQSEADKFAFTREAIGIYLGLLKPDGLISIPVSIKEFPTYVLKVLDTARAGLIDAGVSSPEDHILVYRSSWNARVLVSSEPFSAGDIKKLESFADARSFDVSYAPGLPANLPVWNDLPAVSFTSGAASQSGGEATDSLRDDIRHLFSAKHDSFVKNNFFRITPATSDRPDFYSILRLSNLKSILKNISLVPEREMGSLVNLAVLLQSILLAIIILCLPLLYWRKNIPSARELARPILYFAGLGLGFFFFEVYLIEKASSFLYNDAFGFAIVLAAMLVLSGLGSFWSDKFISRPRRALVRVAAAVALWTFLASVLADPIFSYLQSSPLVIKYIALIIIIAPLAIALGFPFALGLSRFRGNKEYLLPWAWSINGAFSVIAPPLAAIVILSLGYKASIALGALSYIIVLFAYPADRQK